VSVSFNDNEGFSLLKKKDENVFVSPLKIRMTDESHEKDYFTHKLSLLA